MKEKVTIGLVFKRTQLVVDVHLRAHVLARHKAIAVLCGFESLDAYFHDCVGRERIDDALDYVVNPSFAGFTKVEFAQDMIDTAFAGPTMPWGDDPYDMTEKLFVERLEEWATTFDEAEHKMALGALAVAALEHDGARVRELVQPLSRWLDRQAIERANGAEDEDASP